MNISGKITIAHMLAIAGLTSLIVAGLIAHTLPEINNSTFGNILQREAGTLTMIGLYFLTLAIFAYLISQLRKHFFSQSK